MQKTLIVATLCLCVVLVGCGGNDRPLDNGSTIPFTRSPNPPSPKNPAVLSQEMENEILQVYLAERNENSGWDLTLEDVWIERFYGFFNDCAAVLLYNKYLVPPQGVYINNELEIVVGGVSFFYGPITGAQIVVYKEGKLYGLRDAYAGNLLTQDDLENIAWYQSEGMVFPERSSKHPVDKKEIWNGNISQDFDDRTILLLMDKNYTSWRFYASDFAGVDVVEVRSLSVLRLMSPSALIDLKDFRDILAIEIGNPGKQNVINAIRKLEKLGFVQYAGPNYIAYGPGPTGTPGPTP